MPPVETPKQRYLALIEQMKAQRSSYMDHWRELADYILPRRVQWTAQEPDRGDRRNKKIIDDTATYADHTLRAGMMGGVSSPSRPWFLLSTPDPNLNENQAAKQWLFEMTRRMRTVFQKSNVYNALQVFYGDIGTFCTAAMSVVEHPSSVIRCFVHPTGSYMLAQNEWLEVDTFAREFSLTVRQIVDRWGIDNVSGGIKTRYQSGEYEKFMPVCHLVKPNTMADAKRMGSRFKPWSSIYMEAGGDILGEGGFDEFPVMAARWDVSGEDIYGTSCPGMDSLGDIKVLQLMHRRNAQAIDKMVNPPLMADPSLRNAGVTVLPGEVNYISPSSPQGGIKPVYEVQPRTAELLEAIREHQQRISRAYFTDLFLMMAMSDRKQITATEVIERKQEKMIVLGPVLERLNTELFNPLISRTFHIMLRRGLVPPPPPVLQGADLRVEYLSVMAQAQKASAVGGIERFMGFVGNLASANPAALDKIDMDESIEEYGDMVGVPPKIIRGEDQVTEIRQQRAKEQAMEKQAAMVQQMALGAKTLSETDTGGDNALTRLTGA